MSNQEAIALLRNLEDSLDSYCELSEEGKTAFRMAIEALSSSEIPNSSDCISRKAAIDALDEIEAEVADGYGYQYAKWREYFAKMQSAPLTPCEDAVSRKAVAGIYTALWETIGTIMDRDEWDDVCKATANELPSVQPEIVRCKDCKHFKQVFAPNDNDGLCGHWHSKCDARTSRNGYCSHAERREVADGNHN